VNVTNVPLSLKEWSLDTRLLGRKALVASLTRHYFGQALAEAHKARAGRPHPSPPAPPPPRRPGGMCPMQPG